MCGIAGYIGPQKLHKEEIEQISNSIEMRGKDAQGELYRSSDNYNAYLFHSRLSIMDINSRSNQPMSYKSLDMVFNGEIYNFNELKDELKKKGYSFSTSGDSEVLLKAFHFWGEAVIDKLEGMFAFAILDNIKNELYLVRDRAGVKPLFYSLNGSLTFSSNMSTLLKFRKQKWQLNPVKVLEYLNRGYVRAPSTLISGINKLLPGSFAKICLKSNAIVESRYWKLDDHLASNKVKDNLKESVSRLKKHLIKSTEQRLVADCDIGVFLSSGYDSSTLAAIMHKELGSDINAFTLGFKDFKDSENRTASDISRHIGVSHQNLYANIENAKDILKLHPLIWDEPISDVSCIPTAILCKETAKHVKVALSADGVDESFAGYTKYYKILRAFKIRDFLSRFFPIIHSSSIGKYLGNKLSSVKNNKLRLLLTILFSDKSTLDRIFYEFDHVFSLGELANITLKQPDQIRSIVDFSDFNRFYDDLTHLQVITRFDFLCNQQENILPKIDKASMHFGLEVREPMLSKDMVEFGAFCSDYLKISPSGESKYIIKELNREYLPRKLMNKPKKGFTPPLEKWFDQWFDKPLNELINKKHIITKLHKCQIDIDLLKTTILNQNGFQNAKKKWTILVLIQWLDHNKESIV